MTLEAVVLHGVHVVLHANQPPLVLVVLVLVAWPDLLEVGHDVITPGSQSLSLSDIRTLLCSPLHDHLDAGAGRLDDPADLVVAHLEHLLAVDAPDVIPLLETGVLSGAVRLQILQKVRKIQNRHESDDNGHLDPAELDGEGLVLAADNDHAPGLALLPLDSHIDHFLWHPDGCGCSDGPKENHRVCNNKTFQLT